MAAREVTVEIVQGCIAEGKPQPVGKVLTLPRNVGLSMIGAGRAKLVERVESQPVEEQLDKPVPPIEVTERDSEVVSRVRVTPVEPPDAE